MFWSNFRTWAGARPCRARPPPRWPPTRRARSRPGAGPRRTSARSGTCVGCGRPPSADGRRRRRAHVRRPRTGIGRRRAHARSRRRSRSGSVERQALGARDRPDHTRRGGSSRVRRADDLQRLHEHLEPEPAGGARETARRQDVRRTRGVVADDGRAADEDRAGVANTGEKRLGVAHVQLEVLGRERLRASKRISQRCNRLHHDVVILSNKGRDALGQQRVGAEEERLALRPCSACARRSAAQASASAVSSAITITSLGPAGRSMPTRLETSSFAAVTYAFPGPTMRSTGAIVSVPKASAATACAPPMA